MTCFPPWFRGRCGVSKASVSLKSLAYFHFFSGAMRGREDGAATFVSKLLVKNSLPKIAGGKVA